MKRDNPYSGFNTPPLGHAGGFIIETVIETFGYTTQQKLPKEARIEKFLNVVFAENRLIHLKIVEDFTIL
ncbi:MAG: hypothetical protein LBD79_07310 [Treponema sp.]|jgi:hypothetical protein|nr:hypothetical protein [Treponema sp.]